MDSPKTTSSGSCVVACGAGRYRLEKLLEARHRHRRGNAALNLALTRNALLAIIPFEQGEPLSLFFELYHRYQANALNLILFCSPVL